MKGCRIAALTAAVLAAGVGSARAQDAPTGSTAWAWIASYRVAVNAETGWDKALEVAPGLAACTRRLADPGVEGRHHLRLYAHGPEETVRTACTKLRAAGISCRITPPPDGVRPLAPQS